MWSLCTSGCGWKASEGIEDVVTVEPCSPRTDPCSLTDSAPPATPLGETEAARPAPEQPGSPRPAGTLEARGPGEASEVEAWWPADAEKPSHIIEEPLPAAPPARQASKPEATALERLRAALSMEELKAATQALVPGESLDSCLLRFIRHKDLKPVEAAKALRADLAWRASVDPGGLADMKPEEVAECDIRVLQKYMPTWHQGFDRSGRPLMFAHYGKFRFPPVLQHTSVDKLLKLHIHNSERTARLCGLQSAQLGREICGVVTVVDAEGWDSHNLWVKASYAWAQGMATIDQEHYPERLGQMFIINAPQVVYHFWKVIQYVLPERTRERVKLYSGRDKWLPKLLELVDPEELPPEYGGCGVHKGACE